jgi:hypothetical protein
VTRPNVSVAEFWTQLVVLVLTASLPLWLGASLQLFVPGAAAQGILFVAVCGAFVTLNRRVPRRWEASLGSGFYDYTSWVIAPGYVRFICVGYPLDFRLVVLFRFGLFVTFCALAIVASS